MPVDTHQCDVCDDFTGEREEVIEHVANEHDVSEGEAEDHVMTMEDRGI